MSIGASICMDGNCQHKSGDGAKLRLLTSKDAGSKGCSRAGSQTMPYWSWRLLRLCHPCSNGSMRLITMFGSALSQLRTGKASTAPVQTCLRTI